LADAEACIGTPDKSRWVLVGSISCPTKENCQAKNANIGVGVYRLDRYDSDSSYHSYVVIIDATTPYQPYYALQLYNGKFMAELKTPDVEGWSNNGHTYAMNGMNTPGITLADIKAGGYNAAVYKLN
jgi:hypothetical protein